MKYATGCGTLEEVRDKSREPRERSGTGWYRSMDSRGGPKWVGGPSGRPGTGRGTAGMSGTGRGNLGEVRVTLEEFRGTLGKVRGTLGEERRTH